MPISYIVKRARGLSLKSTENADWLSKIMHMFMMHKARIVWSHIGKYMKGEKVLDVGMGSGSISYFLNKKGFKVTGVDVDSLSIYSDLKPVIYDGEKLPFKNNEFDTAVIIHVLHHCSDGLKVLEEVKRVAKRVVVIEDTFRNGLEWFVVGAGDSITNNELWWHKYRKWGEWKKIIKDHGWRLVASDQWSESVTWIYSRYCMFIIE